MRFYFLSFFIKLQYTLTWRLNLNLNMAQQCGIRHLMIFSEATTSTNKIRSHSAYKNNKSVCNTSSVHVVTNFTLIVIVLFVCLHSIFIL